MSQKIGLIAEDMSDIEVIKILAKKISGKSISTSHFVGKGCGPLKRKTPGWCKSLATKGCTKILLVHDRDRNDAILLKNELDGILATAPQATKVVVVPEEELEAWLLSDVVAIKKALNLKKDIKTVHHPEKIESPKEFLRDSIYKVSDKTLQYVNNVHNKTIAENIDVVEISNRCPSFKPFSEFFSR